MDLREQNGHLHEEPVGKLVHDFFDESKRVLNEGTRILRSEVAFAKAEIRDEAKKLGPAAAVGGAGGLLLHVALLMLAFTVGSALAEVMPTWAAFLITTVVFGAIGAGLLAAAKKRLAAVQLKPDQTLHRLEEDQRWTKELTQSARSNLRQDT